MKLHVYIVFCFVLLGIIAFNVMNHINAQLGLQTDVDSHMKLTTVTNDVSRKLEKAQSRVDFSKYFMRKMPKPKCDTNGNDLFHLVLARDDS